MKFQINITKDVLQRSMMCGTNPHGLVTENCAIAVAIRDLFPEMIIGCDICFDGLKESINLPNEATHFILKFDNLRDTPRKRLELPEFSFQIDVPEEYLEDITISEIKEILKNSKSLELIDIK
jgi:hypothetical protein